MTVLPAEVQEVFWNLDPKKLELERDRDLIIATVLPRGREAAVKWLLRAYGRSTIREFLIRDAEGMRTLPESDRKLWLRVLAPDYRPRAGNENRWRISRPA